MSPAHKTEIILGGVITLIGILIQTVGGGILENWNEIFPPSTVTPEITEPSTPEITEPSTPEITEPSEPTCKAERINVGDQEIRTSGNDAKTVNGDSEIDSDDWTRVSLDYNVAVSNKTVVMTLVWEAQELNSNKSLGDTRIKSQKRITLYRVPTECTNSVITGQPNLADRASQTKDFSGERHGLERFASRVGNLRDIRVRFDAPGRSDNRIQQLEGMFGGFSVRISATP